MGSEIIGFAARTHHPSGSPTVGAKPVTPLHDRKLPDFFYSRLSEIAADKRGPLRPTQCRSNPVSGRSLPKTGVFSKYPPETIGLFRLENGQNRSLETSGQFAKARHWRAFLRVSGIFSLSVELVGLGGRSC